MFKRSMQYLVNHPRAIVVLAMILVAPGIMFCLWMWIMYMVVLIGAFSGAYTLS